MAKGSTQKIIWNMFNIPYWHIRIINDEYRILTEIFAKQTLSRKYIKHKPTKTAYLLPDTLKQITKGSKTEVTYNYKNAVPLTAQSENDKEQSKLINEVRKEMQNIRSRFFKEEIDVPISELPINKINNTPIRYNNSVDPIWLYEVVNSKFSKELLEIPKTNLEALMPLIALGLIVVVIIAAMLILGG